MISTFITLAIFGVCRLGTYIVAISLLFGYVHFKAPMTAKFSLKYIRCGDKGLVLNPPEVCSEIRSCAWDFGAELLQAAFLKFCSAGPIDLNQLRLHGVLSGQYNSTQACARPKIWFVEPKPALVQVALLWSNGSSPAAAGAGIL